MFKLRFAMLTALMILGLFLSACSGSDRSGDAAPVRQEVAAVPTPTPEPVPPPVETEVEPEQAPPETSAEPETPPDVVAESNVSAEPASVETAEAMIASLNLSGGIVGFCDTLAISETGEYVLQSCAGEALTGTLEPSDWETLQAWQSNLSSFQKVLDDNPDGPDNLRSEFVFNGRGSEQADEGQQQAMFDWINSLLVRTRPQAVEPPPDLETAELNPAGLCPEVQRPALIVANYENPTGLILIDPASQAQCEFLLDRPPFGRIMTAAGSIYYPVFDSDARTMTIWQVTPEGTQTSLDFTTVSMEQFGPFSFVLSADGSRIAWARTMINPETDPPIFRNDLWAANIDGSGQVTLLEEMENQEFRYLEPVRFSDTGDVLFYALQPDGLGGTIVDFSGRYDTVYSIPTTGGEPQLIFACELEENPLCINDISADGSVLAVGQPADKVIQLIGPAGGLINTIPAPSTDYIGQAIFGPGGNLAFLSATFTSTGEAELARPNPGIISMIEPPYTGEARILLTDNTVAAIWDWLDENRLVYGPINEAGDIGTGLITLDGGLTQVSPSFALAVLR